MNQLIQSQLESNLLNIANTIEQSLDDEMHRYSKLESILGPSTRSFTPTPSPFADRSCSLDLSLSRVCVCVCVCPKLLAKRKGWRTWARRTWTGCASSGLLR